MGQFEGQDILNFIEELRNDFESKCNFIFLTNNTDLIAEQIALLYKNRWQVELFFI